MAVAETIGAERHAGARRSGARRWPAQAGIAFRRILGPLGQPTPSARPLASPEPLRAPWVCGDPEGPRQTDAQSDGSEGPVIGRMACAFVQCGCLVWGRGAHKAMPQGQSAPDQRPEVTLGHGGRSRWCRAPPPPARTMAGRKEVRGPTGESAAGAGQGMGHAFLGKI